MKKKIVLIALLVICLSLIGYGTYAYFTAQGRATNVVTAGNIKVRLVVDGETAEEGNTSSVDTSVTLAPGEYVEQTVCVKNAGTHPEYVRMAVRTSVTLANGTTSDDMMFKLAVNTEKWTEKDGYYYYNEVLEPGAVTEPLYTSYTADADKFTNEYQNCSISMKIGAMATQAENNGTNVTEAAGWPEI